MIHALRTSKWFRGTMIHALRTPKWFRGTPESSAVDLCGAPVEELARREPLVGRRASGGRSRGTTAPGAPVEELARREPLLGRRASGGWSRGTTVPGALSGQCVPLQLISAGIKGAEEESTLFPGQ